MRLTGLREKETEIKDLEFSLVGLRKDWKQQPERRVEIEAMARTITQQIATLKQQIPMRISELEKQDPGLSGILLETMILSLSNYLNIGKNIRPDQIRETAELLVAEYPHLSLEHFAVVLQRAKKGQWGEIYDRLDGVVIARWLEKLQEELRADAQLKNENHHLANKHSRAASGEIYSIRDAISKHFGHESDQHQTD